MFSDFLDHGLPLVSLKEQRRDLVVSLTGGNGPLSKKKIAEIAAIQQAIAAIGAVICDVDAEVASFEKPILTINRHCGSLWALASDLSPQEPSGFPPRLSRHWAAGDGHLFVSDG